MADGTVGGIVAAAVGRGAGPSGGSAPDGAGAFQALLASRAAPAAGTPVAEPPAPPAPDPSAEVEAAYREVLGRGADAGGLAAFEGLLAAGGSPADVRASLARSAEAGSALDAAYRSVLGRGADAGGLAAAEDALAHGASLADVRSGLARSDEAAAGVDAAYRGVLGRGADAGGLAAYEGALASGRSLADVRLDLARSGEAAGGLAAACRDVLGREAGAGELAELEDALARDGLPAGGLREAVVRSALVDRGVDALHREVLGRGATPDEVAAQRALLARPGATLASLLAGARAVLARSAEAGAAVDAAYKGVLGRAADAGAVAWGEDRLAAGATLAEVRSGLAHSAEAEAGLVAAYGLELGRAADRGGLDYHEGRLAQGATAEQVRSEIAHSAEVAGRVRALYRDALGRDATAADLDKFAGALARGRAIGPMLDTLRAALFASDEAGAAVERAYADVLGRGADAGSAADFRTGHGWATSVSDLRAKLAASDEARAAVRALYVPALGREATDAEAAQARAVLAGGGSLQGVLSGLLHSAGASASARAVEGLYEAELGRAADLGGLVFFEGRLAAGASAEALRAGLAGSGEAARAVDGLYRAVLGRGADAGGLATYQGELAAGTGLSGVRSEIAHSEEAAGRARALFAQNLGRAPSEDELRGFEAGLARPEAAGATFAVSTPGGGAGKLADVDARALVAELAVYVTRSGGLTPTLTAADGQALTFRNASELAGFALGAAQGQGRADKAAWTTHGLTATWLSEVGQGYIEAARRLRDGAQASASAGDAQGAYLQGIGAQLAMRVQAMPPGQRHGVTERVPLGAMAAEVTVSGDLSDPSGKAGFGYRVYDPDPKRSELIAQAQGLVGKAQEAEAAGNKLLAFLHQAQARVDVAYARLPADRRTDKMLGVAQRFVDAAYAASGRGDWNLVQTLETAADVSLQIAAKPEGQRVRTTERFMHKKVKHDVTVDPNDADPFATFKDHSKGEDIGAYVEQAVGVVLNVAAFIPVVQVVAAPLAAAWDAAQAGKSFANGDVLGGVLNLGSAVGVGLTGLSAVAEGTSFASAAAQDAVAALDTSAEALGTLGREVLAGTGLVGGLSGVARGAANGDALGIAAGVLQTTAAVASGLAASGSLDAAVGATPAEAVSAAAARKFATDVAWAAGLASAGVGAADAFAHGDLAGGLLTSLGALLAETASEVFKDAPSGNQGAATVPVAQESLPAPGPGGAGSGAFALDADALGWGGAAGAPGADAGGEAPPAPVGGQDTSATRGTAAPFDTGGETAPVNAGGTATPTPTMPDTPAPTDVQGAAQTPVTSDAGAGTDGPMTPTQAQTTPRPAQDLPTPPVPPGEGAPPTQGQRDAGAILGGMDGARAPGTGGGTPVAAGDAASSFGNAVPAVGGTLAAGVAGGYVTVAPAAGGGGLLGWLGAGLGRLFTVAGWGAVAGVALYPGSANPADQGGTGWGGGGSLDYHAGETRLDLTWAPGGGALRYEGGGVLRTEDGAVGGVSLSYDRTDGTLRTAGGRAVGWLNDNGLSVNEAWLTGAKAGNVEQLIPPALPDTKDPGYTPGSQPPPPPGTSTAPDLGKPGEGGFTPASTLPQAEPGSSIDGELQGPQIVTIKAPSPLKAYADDPERLEGRASSDVEAEMDRVLVNDAGWTKAPSRDGNGVAYRDGKGGLLIINNGYGADAGGGQGDLTHQGPYAKLSTSGQTTRIPLLGNPALTGGQN